MRIAFCGASGTGKTTLAKYLADRVELPFNPVGSRSTAAELGFSSPYDVDKACSKAYHRALAGGGTAAEAAERSLEVGCTDHPTMRGEFQRKLQLAKIEWETANPDFVTDRSTVDDFVYCALHNYKAMDEGYLKRAQEHLKTYDIIFFTPMNAFHNVSDDPARLGEKTYHKVFEDIADGLLVTWLGDDWNEQVREVFETDLEDRQALVYNAHQREWMNPWRGRLR